MKPGQGENRSIIMSGVFRLWDSDCPDMELSTPVFVLLMLALAKALGEAD